MHALRSRSSACVPAFIHTPHPHSLIGQTTRHLVTYSSSLLTCSSPAGAGASTAGRRRGDGTPHAARHAAGGRRGNGAQPHGRGGRTHTSSRVLFLAFSP